MHCIYFPYFEKNQTQIVVDDKDEIHHVSHVMRLGIGDSVTFLNGKGLQAQANILSLSKKELSASIENIVFYPEEKIKIVLACALSKRVKFEFIVEKATELGVDEIVPLMTERTEVRLDMRRALNKLSRYEMVAINAMKQCHRKYLPHIHPVLTLEDYLKLPHFDEQHKAYIPHLAEKSQHFKSAVKKCDQKFLKQVTIFIGPEGDFSPLEVQQVCEKGAQSVTLGSNTLKVDTAALACVGFCHFYLRS